MKKLLFPLLFLAALYAFPGKAAVFPQTNVCDGVSAANCASVKAAGTSPTTSDFPLVVTISPQGLVTSASTSLGQSLNNMSCWTVTSLPSANTNGLTYPCYSFPDGAIAFDLSSIQGVALGAMANYGTSPGAVKVPGVNAYVTNTVAENLAQVNGVTTLAGTGAVGTGAQRIAVGTDTATIAGSAPTTVLLATPTPTAGQGCTPYHLAGGSAASTNSNNVKASAGTICDMHVINTTSTTYFLRLYNLSTAPTCSSATGAVDSIPIPNAAAAGAGVAPTFPMGVAYQTGIGFCLTGGGADTDNTSAATGVYISISYK